VSADGKVCVIYWFTFHSRLAEEYKNFVLLFLDLLFIGIQDEKYLSPVRKLFAVIDQLMRPIEVSELDSMFAQLQSSLKVIQV
jgi:hypothetical protein